MSVRKLTGMLFLVNGLQFLLGAAILLGLLTDIVEYSEMLLDLSVCLVLLSSLLSMAGLMSVVRYQDRSYRESMENLEHLNIRLREQRHDYLNQIQIVYGLLELNAFDEAKEYLSPVFRDIMKVNQALRTSEPAVNALLQAKLEEAERQGIRFCLEVGTQLERLPVEPWEFCKILANLIDNAVAAAGQNEKEKWVRLRMEETPAQYRIVVVNNGPEITEYQQKLIFTRGYTTKKGEGHGMGLAIVASVLKEAGGEIFVNSSPQETSFAFTLPKQKKVRKRLRDAVSS